MALADTYKTECEKCGYQRVSHADRYCSECGHKRDVPSHDDIMGGLQ